MVSRLTQNLNKKQKDLLLRVIAEVRDSDIYNAPRVLNREIKLALDDAGIVIPFQQVVVHQAKD